MINTLYEIKNEAIRRWQEVENEEQEKELKEQVDIAIKEQSLDVVNVLKNMQTYAKALKDAETEYKQKRQEIENKYEKAKMYIKQNMEMLGYEKIETPLGSLQIRKCPPSVDVIDETAIPQEYIKEEVVRKIDKLKILDAFKKDGEVVNGTRIIQNNTTLVIK